MNNPLQSMIQQAIQAFQSGNINSAEITLGKVLAVHPKNLPALHVLGLIKASLSKHEEAAELLKRAIYLDPNEPSLHYNLAKALQESGRDEESLPHHKKCIDLAPSNPDAWLNYGKSLSRLKLHDKAFNAYQKCLEIKPNYEEAFLNLGSTLKELRQYEDAVIYADKAISLNPKLSEAWSNRGVSLKELKRYEEALASYDHAITLQPVYHEAWSNRGIVLQGLKRYEEALASYDHAITLQPDYHEAWSNRGIVLQGLKRYEEALASYDHAITLQPDYHEAWSNKSVLLLHLKHYELGWEIFSWRHNLIDLQFEAPLEKLQLWDGSCFCENLLVLSEQGIGDMVFYASMLGCLEKKVKKITVSLDVRLIPIFTRSFANINFIDKQQAVNVDLYDAQIPIGSLSKILNMKPDMKDRHTPYLLDDPKLTECITNLVKTKDQLICGIAWKSNNSKIGSEKSIALSELHKILEIKGFEFINLQYGNTEEEIRDLEQSLGLQITTIEGVDLFENIDALLSIIQTCDVVVTTSNVTAHLAGALGKQTLLLSPQSAGRIWYWHDECQSCWYPTISIYSQNLQFEWHQAIKDIVTKLNSQICSISNDAIKI